MIAKIFFISFLTLVAMTNIYRMISVLPARVFQWDFNHYYLTARLYRLGLDPYMVPMSSVNYNNEFVISDKIPTATNPPFLTYLLSKLTMLTPEYAYTIILLLQIVSLIVLILFGCKVITTKINIKQLIIILLMCFSSRVVYEHFYFSQIQLIIAAMLVVALYLLKHDRGCMACVLVSIAGMLKLYPLVMLPWFLYRKASGVSSFMKRTVAVIVTVIMCILISKAVLWPSFFETAPEVIYKFTLNRGGNYSLHSLIGDSVYIKKIFVASWMPDFFSGLLPFFIVLVVAAAVLAFCYYNSVDIVMEFSLLSSMMLLVNLTTWNHYFVLSIFSLMALAISINESGCYGGKSIVAICVLLVEAPYLANIYEVSSYYGRIIDKFPVFALVIILLVYGTTLYSRAALSRGKSLCRTDS